MENYLPIHSTVFYSIAILLLGFSKVNLFKLAYNSPLWSSHAPIWRNYYE